MKRLFAALTIACLLLCGCAGSKGGSEDTTVSVDTTYAQVTEAETERRFDGSKGEAYEIAVQYCIDNYGDSYDDFEVGFEISDQLWRVYFYDPSNRLEGAPDISIDPSSGEIISCVMQSK